ncbi:MAG: Major Facilitator Superfamily protein [candidate division TA06 bacterium ADurb.Bin131]|uniref:Major Facilitator Superfamily protein n=1 Tax=candidate division TA06 bacterium ADurb.Bin131 TaxID=1852827 RepID=A0A1V6C547_UNCT6|nr:MAG: Major Facilitator Superfamily protein [candidate division TA06 bacterium ADurb.Bin131]
MNTIMKKGLWIYIFPALMDFSVAAVLLFSSIRAVELGVSSVVMGILGSVWGITYSFSSIMLSKVISKKNAPWFMIASCISFIFIGGFFYFCVSLFPLFVLLFLGGFCSSFFFVGFQIFMGNNTGLAYHKSSAFYTLSWSGGMAFGSLAEGSLINSGVFYAQLPIFISSLIIISGIILSEKIKKPLDVIIEEDKKEAQRSPFVKKYVWIAWAEIFCVALVTTGVRYLLPKVAISSFMFSKQMAGIAVFVFFIFQAIAGYAVSFFSVFRYRISSHHIMKLLGIISLIVPLVFYKSAAIFIFAGLLGIYAGHAFYTSVFYAINDEEKSGFNIGINEALVGIASVCGPFLLGIMLNISIGWFLLFPCIILFLAGLVQHLFLKYSAI